MKMFDTKHTKIQDSKFKVGLKMKMFNTKIKGEHEENLRR